MVTLINPNLAVQKNDLFTTGIVYMPIGLAYVASSLRDAGIQVGVIDAFGEEPYQMRSENEFLILGLSCSDIIKRIPEDENLVFVYANNISNHIAVLQIIQSVSESRPGAKIVVLENTQSVTAYALKFVAGEFYEAGADFILSGEGERISVLFTKAFLDNRSETILKEIDGIGSPEFTNDREDKNTDLDGLSFPAWDLFPIDNYWRLRFAHGPLTGKRYLPILTSRGCPYNCNFCVTGSINNHRWNSRSPRNVTDEMEYFIAKYDVHEFHFEDLNPTVSDERIREICNEILRRRLSVIWKCAAGTKVETIKNEETIELMASAGCRYISISPETGSKDLLDRMSKTFDVEHAVRLVRRMKKVGIRSQGCFILGYPGETKFDLDMTWNLVHDLTCNGLDEIALFIIAPLPGAKLYETYRGLRSLSTLSFSPSWMADYKCLNKYRLKLYAAFLFWKLRYNPLKIVLQPLNFVRRKFETKMEMVPYRALVLKLLKTRMELKRLKLYFAA